jgi:hypothetical protein
MWYLQVSGMKLLQKLKNNTKLGKIIFICLIIAFAILVPARIFLNDYLSRTKEIANYEGDLLTYDVYNILQVIFDGPIEVEFQKVKHRRKTIFGEAMTRGEYEYKITVKDTTQMILVNWEMLEDESPSIVSIKESRHGEIIFQKYSDNLK